MEFPFDHYFATSGYPQKSETPPEQFRGRPVVRPERCSGDGACAEVCPTRGIQADPWRVDLGKCIFCGLCAEACTSQAIELSQDFELATRKREALIVGGSAPTQVNKQVAIATEATGEQTVNGQDARGISASKLLKQRMLPTIQPDLETLGRQLRDKVQRLLKRSLHIRHLDSGSCNGCDWELANLLSPIHDIQRLGLDFVASPRHADLLLTTGTMTRNLSIAAIRTYQAMARPRLVVAVGACGCSGGVFAQGYAGGGGTETILPVDVFVPGCPPRPQAIIYGLLLAMGRLEQRL